MKKLMRNLLLTILLSISIHHAYALDITRLPDVKDGIVSIQIVDPVKDVGYTVGDVLQRQITLTIK